MRSKPIILGVTVCLLLCAAAAQAKETKTVAVDCAKGDSISAALEDTADELIIEISGLCYENVEIRRDDVTLQGTDPTVDGIAGPSPDSTDSSLVWIRHAARITLRSLSFANSNSHGLLVQSGQGVQVEDCVFRDNLLDGANFYEGATAQIFDSRFEDNTRLGLRAAGPSTVIATDSVFAYNGNWAVVSIEDATVRLFGTACSVDANSRGLIAVQDAFLWVSDCSVRAPNGTAFKAQEQADLNIAWVNFTGDLVAEWKSLVWLVLSYQDAPGPAGNHFDHDSTLLMQYGAGLGGVTTFARFSNGSIQHGPGSFGLLVCETGGDMVCDGGTPATNAGATGCGYCP